MALRRHTLAVSLSLEWIRDSQKVIKKLERNLKRLRSLKAQFDIVSETVLEDIEDAENLQRKQEHVIDGLGEENKVMSKIMIPQLIAAHKLILERYDAEMAIEVKKRTASRPQEE